MNACVSANALARQLQQLSGVFLLSLFFIQPAAYAASVATRSGQHDNVGAGLVPLEPRAEPYALSADSGKTMVRFSVRLAGKAKSKSSATVYLRRRGDRVSIAMNDQGKDGDLIAKDGIYGVSIQIAASLLKPDSCLEYEAFIITGRIRVPSSPLSLCVSSFPVRAAASDTEKPDVLPDGMKAVADEILITAKPGTRPDAIRRVATGIHAKVVGSIPPLNLYQLRLSSPVSSSRLMELVAQLSARTELRVASVNAIGSYAYTPNDPEFVNQHGLKLAIAHNAATGVNAWDVGAIGTGVTVTVLDSGLDKTHPDYGTSPGNCQLAEDDCGAASTDTIGHGTQVAGVVGAKTNDTLGVAGAAYGSKIHSIVVGGGASPTLLQMTQGFTDAAAYGVSSVINASFDVMISAFTNVTTLCSSVNSAVLIGATPVAVVVNAAGNSGSNGYFYPGRCNVNDLVSHVGQHEALTRKDLLITVANSASIVDPICGSVAPDHLCVGSVPSNYGSWVDIAAPGSLIRTTAAGGGYVSPTGTSFSAPLVAGAAAILKSCGVALDQIEPALRTSANVTVAFPDGSSAPRLDIYRAMMQLNHVPTGVGLSNSSLNEHIDTTGGYDVGTLSAVDTDTCDKFTFSIVGGADMASFSINPATSTLRINAGILNYVAKASYAVTIRVADYWGAAFDQPITVNVINVNDPPTALQLLNTVPSTPENGGSIKVADISIVDDGLGTNLLSLSGADAASFNIIGNALYFNGSANFEVKNSYNVTVNVDDLSVGATPDAMQNFALAITNVNEAPVANNDTLAAIQDMPVTYAAAQLLGNDTDVDAGTTLAIAGVTSGAGGSVVLNGDGTVTYTPTAGFSGTANFTYTATDGSLSSNVATVTVNVAAVNHAPVANNDVLSATEDIPVIYTALQLLGNDTDVDAGTTLVIANVTSGTGGTVVLNGDGTVGFTPNANFNGVASFSYSASDGSLPSNVAMVTVNVTPVNDPPTGLPFITGIRTVGQTLTADTSAIADADGLGPFSYQWLRDGNPIGTNSNTYTLVAADYNGFMSLCVSYTDGGGTHEMVCSAADAVAVGDPHITTVDGLHYDFQSAGEFVALRGVAGMEIQVRQTPVFTASALTDGYSGLNSGVSINTAVAARLNNHRVTFQPNISGNPASSNLELRVDGVVASLPPDGLALGIGGRVISSAGGGIQVDFPDGTTMIATPYWWGSNSVWYLNVSVFHTTAYNGIMGARAGGSWLPRLSDGSALGALPSALHDRYVDLYMKFADSWRVNEKTSLFDYAKDTSTRTFTFREWPRENGPYVIGNRPVIKPAARKIARQLCRGVVGKNNNADCVFDVMAMGNRDIAKTHLLTQKIQAGLTSIIVHDDRDSFKDKEVVTFTATVIRHAAISRLETNGKGVPAGMVQFTVNGEKAGKPVKLDLRGQAIWKAARPKVDKQLVGVRYIPARGSPFLSSSIEVSRPVTMGK